MRRAGIAAVLLLPALLSCGGRSSPFCCAAASSAIHLSDGVLIPGAS